MIRLLTTENSFGGGGNPFDRVLVGEFVGGARSRPLSSTAVEMITAELGPGADVEVVPDAEATIAELFEQDATGIAVVAIDDMRVGVQTAEVDLTMWCGSLCGVALTYEAEYRDAGGWTILGPVGPIAVS